MFNRKPMVKKKQGMMEAVDDPDLSFSKIKKDFQLFASSHMTWKDKKALENQKVSGLGGKPQRKQRLPLTVARVQMKKQKEREEKTFEQVKFLDNLTLGRSQVSLLLPSTVCCAECDFWTIWWYK
ncbi:unnamed protein product [Brassica rapa subsp. trilocularis]